MIYQIYPRSFQDSNGDGIGDLGGVIQRLDYLVALGVDAVWLSPFYRSPMVDFGYDVRDHVSVDPIFGDMADFRALARACRERGLKLIVDYIPNHTSDCHLWFNESRSSRHNPRRDWYIWRDAAPDGGPPNNWQSEFGGPAWTWDVQRQQYYYHAFLSCQPDLNWRCPDVVEAMLNVMRFWLDRGVDGFRVDAIHHLMEREDLADNPLNTLWREGMDPADRLMRTGTVDQPDVHGAVSAMRRVLDDYPGERVLIGEAYLPLERLVTYYGAPDTGFHLPFNFHLMATPWTPTAVSSLIAAYERQLPDHGWPNWVLSNHDRPRLASRIGAAQTRVAAMLLLTLRGTPTLYQGEELGMTDVAIAPDRVRDPLEINVPGLGLGRDPARTPMMWSAEPFSGFSTVEPWLPLSADWPDMHVERQAVAPDSLLALYGSLLALRRTEPALQLGDHIPFAATNNLLAYERIMGAVRLLIVLNMGAHDETLTLPRGDIVMTTQGQGLGLHPAGPIRVAAHQGLILRRT
ncbi:alpha-amylase family glycosyl hydrolase [soil metagenome]